MDSNYIKEAVIKIRKIVATEDVNFSNNETKAIGASLLKHLAMHFKDAPITVTAMTQYLVDHGYKLSNLKGEAYFEFMSCFGEKISECSQEQINRLRKISKKLMAS